MPKRLILIVGLPGSGKSLAAAMLARLTNAAMISSGDVIRAEIRARGLRYTPATDTAIARWFHSAGRERLLAERVWKMARRAKASTVIIEGFRSPVHIRYLHKLSGVRPIVIAIEAPFAIRAARELRRGRFGKAESLAYLRQRELEERARGIGKLLARAHYRIDNSGSRAQLQQQLKKLFKFAQ